MTQPSGPILDGLGVTLDIEEGDLVETAVVIAKILCNDGHTSLVIGSSDGSSWLEHLGLVTAAADLIRPSRWRSAHGDEESDE